MLIKLLLSPSHIIYILTYIRTTTQTRFDVQTRAIEVKRSTSSRRHILPHIFWRPNREHTVAVEVRYALTTIQLCEVHIANVHIYDYDCIRYAYGNLTNSNLSVLVPSNQDILRKLAAAPNDTIRARILKNYNEDKRSCYTKRSYKTNSKSSNTKMRKKQQNKRLALG